MEPFVSPWGNGMSWHVTPEGSRGEVPATQGVLRSRKKTSTRVAGDGQRRRAIAELVRATDVALLASIEAESDREARRQMLLQQTSNLDERQHLELIFTHERAQAAQELMQLTSEHDAAMWRRCNELEVKNIDKHTILRSSLQPTLIYKGGKRNLSSTRTPMQSRNLPPKIDTGDHEVLVKWAARSVLRATRYAKALPGVFPSKNIPSPFKGPQKLHYGVYPMSSTPLPGRRSPFLRAKEDPEVIAPFLRRPMESNNTELLMFDSAATTPSIKSRVVSRQSSREVQSGRHSTTTYQGNQSEGLRELSFSPVSPQRSVTSQRSQSPLQQKCSGSAPRRMASTSPIRAEAIRRQISLQAALCASLSERTPESDSALTSTYIKDTQWDEAAHALVAMTYPSRTETTSGELFTEANVSATMARASLAATEREIIRQTVDLPSGSALGLFGKDRPITPNEERQIKQEAQLLLSQNSAARYNTDLEAARKAHSRHRMLSSRMGSQNQTVQHYDNVRLRTVISDLIDQVIYANKIEDDHERNVQALGDSIARLAVKDATSALSLFPGILEVLFTVLEGNTSKVSRAAIAEGLCCISRQAPVQEALITGSYCRQGEQRRITDILTDLMLESSDIILITIFGTIVSQLCQTERGFQAVAESGLLEALKRKSAESDNIMILYEEASNAGEKHALARDRLSAFNDCLSTIQVEERSSSSIGTIRSRTSFRASCTVASPTSNDRMQRHSWKPVSDTALPIWERPADVIGVNNKLWRGRAQSSKRSMISQRIE